MIIIIESVPIRIIKMQNYYFNRHGIFRKIYFKTTFVAPLKSYVKLNFV